MCMRVVRLPHLFLQLTSSCKMVKVEECDPDKWGDTKSCAEEETARGNKHVSGGEEEGQEKPRDHQDFTAYFCLWPALILS